MTRGTGAAGTMTRGTGDIHPSGGTLGSTTLTSGEHRTSLIIRMSTITITMITSMVPQVVRTDITDTGRHPDPASGEHMRQGTVHHLPHQERHQ